MPVPLTRIKVGEQRPIRQHYLAQEKRRVLAHDHPAGRRGLEVFPMRFRIFGKGELIAWGGQHPYVDRVNEQLAGRPDLEVRQLTAELSLSNLQNQAGHDPFGG